MMTTSVFNVLVGTKNNMNLRMTSIDTLARGSFFTALLLLGGCGKLASLDGSESVTSNAPENESVSKLQDNFKFEKILNKSIAMISADDGSYLYALQADGSTLLFSKDAGKSWKAFVFPTSQANMVGIKTVRAGASGDIFVGTSGGVGIFGEESQSIKFRTVDHGLISNDVRALFVDGAGKVFAAHQEGDGGSRGGVSVSINNGKSFTAIGKSRGLVNKNYSSICGDQEGRLFVGGLRDTGSPLAISKDGGKNFIEKSVEGQLQRVVVFCETTGPVHIVGYGEKETIHYVTVNGGDTFQINNYPKMNRIYIDGSGRVFRFDNQNHCDVSFDRGKNFQPFDTKKMGLGRIDFTYAQLSVDDHGIVYLTPGVNDPAKKGLYRSNVPLPVPDAFTPPTSSPSRMVSSVPEGEPSK